MASLGAQAAASPLWAYGTVCLGFLMELLLVCTAEWLKAVPWGRGKLWILPWAGRRERPGIAGPSLCRMFCLCRQCPMCMASHSSSSPPEMCGHGGPWGVQYQTPVPSLYSCIAV